MYINFKPDASGVRLELPFELENKTTFFYFTLLVLVAVYALLRRLLFSPFGRVLAGLRVNEHRMRAVGYGSFGYKLSAFTLAGTLAGVAGYLWAAQTGFVNPELMGFHMSAHAIMMVILGGMGNFAGAIVGAFAFEYVMHFFQRPEQTLAAAHGHLHRAGGGVRAARPARSGRAFLWQTEGRGMSAALLSAQKLVKRFGGLAAVNEVSVDLLRDHIHAVIGPNGAGKSTLTNLLSGDLPPTSGRITLGGVDIAGRSPEAISRLGLGRSYQKTNIFLPFTVWDNVRLASQSRERHAPWNPMRWLQTADSLAPVNARCERAIELAGLSHRARAVAATISHGEQRQLEIAMTLATEPTVLLLDEPLAGMGQAEAETMVALLQKLKTDHAIMLVEHDMDAVFALADRLTVMVNGQVIASGTPAEVRADPLVQAAYLGEEH